MAKAFRGTIQRKQSSTCQPVFDPAYVKTLHGEHGKKRKSCHEPAEPSLEELQIVRKQNGFSRW